MLKSSYVYRAIHQKNGNLKQNTNPKKKCQYFACAARNRETNEFVLRKMLGKGPSRSLLAKPLRKFGNTLFLSLSLSLSPPALSTSLVESLVLRRRVGRRLTVRFIAYVATREKPNSETRFERPMPSFHLILPLSYTCFYTLLKILYPVSNY